MALFKELFASEFGVFSFVVVLGILIMAIYFVWLFIKKSGDAAKQYNNNRNEP